MASAKLRRSGVENAELELGIRVIMTYEFGPHVRTTVARFMQTQGDFYENPL
jgi:hypothetical protein